jgi:4'-phosphopantetheinyl transferase EntD
MAPPANINIKRIIYAAQSLPLPDVAFGVSEIVRMDFSLLMQSHVDLPNASEKRKHDYVCGRQAARDALNLLSAPVTRVERGSAGQPIWPSGFVGSISHAAGLGIAAASSSSIYETIGIDMEVQKSVTADIWPHFMHADELRFISRLEKRMQSRFASICFSAKESFFKLQYPCCRSWLEFADLTISSTDDGQFQVAIVDPGKMPERFRQVIGYFSEIDGMVITAITLPYRG